MKAFLVACAAAIVLAVLGGVVLDSVQKSADQAFRTQFTRV